MAESLNGKVAVITGVGSGFGKATAELFAELDQVNLVLIDYNKEALEATAEVCRGFGSKVIALDADVTKVEDLQEISRHNVFMTPAIIIDGKIKSSGKVVKPDQIRKWLTDTK